MNCSTVDMNGGVVMLERLKKLVKTEELTCTVCGMKMKEGDSFTATITLPAEKNMLVGPLDKVIAKTATRVLCSSCKE